MKFTGKTLPEKTIQFALIILVAWLPFFIGAWDKDIPAATTSMKSSNPQLLANNAALETAFNREHEFSTGGTTADQMHHRPGSARAFFQDAQPGTRIDGTAFTSTDLGSLWFDTNATPDNLGYVLTATTPTWTLKSTSTIAEMVAAAHTWSGHQTLAAGYDLLGSTTSDINIGSGNFTVAGATGNTSVGGVFESVGIATLADASVTKTTAAPSADAQIANKKYVDDQKTVSDARIKAWVTFDGVGTIEDSYNVSGVVRDSTGVFTVSWDTDFANTSYCCVAQGEDIAQINTRLKAVDTVQIRFYDSAGNLANPTSGNVMAVGDQT